MQIDKLTIRNFRNFSKEETYKLNPNFTVVIGINGKGKSTLLHALRIAAGAYLLGIPEAQKRHIWEREIHFEVLRGMLISQTPTIVKAEGSIDGQNLAKPWQRMIPEGKIKTTSSNNDVGEIRNIAQQKYKAINSGDIRNIDNPVIAFFGTGRLSGSTRNTLGSFVGKRIFKYGYYNWSDMQYSSYQYVYWLNSFDFLEYEEKESLDNYAAFMQALRDANPYIKQIGFDGKELRLKVKMNEEDPLSQFLPLSLHSDGIIAHTAMVAELAFRCIMLNGHHGREAIKQSRGLVMIDEIDLHIHPSWQKHVISDLKKAFPNIQFVATSHSPFIVQSVSSEELINLDRLTDIPIQDLNIDEVSTEVMGIESEFSNKAERQHDETKSILAFLKSDASNQQKMERIKTVSDPSLRALLELKYLSEE